MKRKKYYMHTIEGCPAFFDKDQICYANNYGAWAHNVLVNSLGQIRNEQKRSIKYRTDLGLEDSHDKYNYILAYGDIK